MGTITKRGKKFRAIVRIGEFKLKPIKKTFPSKALAKRFISEKELEIQKGTYKTDTNYPTLKNLINRYLIEVSCRKSDFVRKWEAYSLSKFVKEFPQINLKIDQLTPQHIGSFRNKYIQGRKISTWLRFLTILKHMWIVAQTEWGYPLDSIFNNLQKLKRPEPRFRRLTDREFTLLTKGNHTVEIMRNIINLALETGLRRGEILGIKDEHIKDNTLVIPVRKNGSINSEIPLTNKAKSILKSMELPIPLHYEGLKSKWRRLVEKYEIKDLHFHDLRHEAISRYLEKGLPIQDVQVISGHKDINILMNVYGNLRASTIASKLNLGS